MSRALGVFITWFAVTVQGIFGLWLLWGVATATSPPAVIFLFFLAVLFWAATLLYLKWPSQ